MDMLDMSGGEHKHWVESEQRFTQLSAHQHTFLINGKILATEFGGYHRHELDLEKKQVLAATGEHAHEFFINDSFVMTDKEATHTHNWDSIEFVESQDKTSLADSGAHTHSIEVDGITYESLSQNSSFEIKKGMAFHVQAVLFAKDRFREYEKTADWIETNGFHQRGYEERVDAYTYEQMPRSSFVESTLKTIPLYDGIEAVIGEKLESADPMPLDFDEQTFAEFQEYLTNGGVVLTAEEVEQLEQLKDEYKAKIEALKSMLMSANETIFSLVTSMQPQEKSSEAVEASERLSANLGQLDQTLSALDYPEQKSEVDESVSKAFFGIDGALEAAKAVKEILKPVATTFKGSGFKTFETLIEATAKSLENFSRNYDKFKEAIPEQTKDLQKILSDITAQKTVIPVEKKQDERIAFGIVLEPDVTDLHGDTYDEQTVLAAAHFFMEKFQKIKLMHEVDVTSEVNILESFVAPVDMTIEAKKGEPFTIRKGTWLLKVRIVSDDLWAEVKSGKLTGFSIGALANIQDLT